MLVWLFSNTMLKPEFYVPEEKDKSTSSKIILSFFKPETLAKI